MRTKESAQTTKKLCLANGESEYILNLFGDHIAEREAYKELHGIDAIHFYICHKFRWPPAQVKSMTAHDLEFLLTEEMQDWTVPKELRDE